MTLKEQALKELATRRLEEIHAPQRDSLLDFIQLYFKNEKPKGITNFHISPFHKVIADRLEKVIKWEITRLIINIPPWHWKTELITKSFPVHAMGNNPYLQVIATGYSTTLTQGFSSEAKDYYKSDTFKSVFPRSNWINRSQDTKEHWKTAEWWSYYATWFDWSITGKRSNIFIIDDPIKPKEADRSDVVRDWVNNLFLTTVPSRLFNPEKDAIIIIMQRTHDNDLCGYLIDRMNNGWSEYEVISMPAIADHDEVWETEKYWTITRAKGEALDENRFPLSTLDILKSDMMNWDWWMSARSTQYQQEPINKETQEFHEERFKYHGEWTENKTPTSLRIFTSVDPAFKKWQHNDQTSIMTVWLSSDQVYILEYTAGKYSAVELQDKIIYHVQKWNPEKVGIEAFQAQTMIAQHLRLELQRRNIYASIEEIKQTGDKLTKIRKLIAPYRRGQVYHKHWMDWLETELKRFPRGKHDDIIDSLQMVYDMIYLTPWTKVKVEYKFEFDSNGIPYTIWS